MPLKKLRETPQIARYYLLGAAFLIALPSILSSDKGHTGKFLIATHLTAGTVFEEAVIYIDEHTLMGAHGVIINKPLFTQEDNIFKNVFHGGPVGEEEAVFLFFPDANGLHGYTLADIRQLRADLPEILKQIEETPKIRDKTYMFKGYAGWGPFQLNQEIVRGGWGVIEYDTELMFNTPPEQIWDKAMEIYLEQNPVKSGEV